MAVRGQSVTGPLPTDGESLRSPLRSRLPDGQHPEKRPVCQLRPGNHHAPAGISCILPFSWGAPGPGKGQTAPRGHEGAGGPCRSGRPWLGSGSRSCPWQAGAPCGLDAFPLTVGLRNRGEESPIHHGEPLPWCQPWGHSAPEFHVPLGKCVSGQVPAWPLEF